MNRDAAFALSDALAVAGFSHEVLVGVGDNLNPRESYTVYVRCNLTMDADEIDTLRDIAREHEMGLAFSQPSFVFREPKLKR